MASCLGRLSWGISVNIVWEFFFPWHTCLAFLSLLPHCISAGFFLALGHVMTLWQPFLGTWSCDYSLATCILLYYRFILNDLTASPNIDITAPTYTKKDKGLWRGCGTSAALCLSLIWIAIYLTEVQGVEPPVLALYRAHIRGLI